MELFKEDLEFSKGEGTEEGIPFFFFFCLQKSSEACPNIVSGSLEVPETV